MDEIFKYQMTLAISKLKGNNFQDFINELMLEKYGDNFVSVRQKRDAGCDGILENHKILAAYAPEKNPGIREFSKKVKEDYEKYEENWKHKYPYFCVVYNGEFTAKMLQFMGDLDFCIIKWDIHQIIKIIESLHWSKVRKISNFLGINEQYFTYDILKNVVDHLINNGSDIQTTENKKPLYIVDKIGLNYSEDDVDGALNEYLEFIPYLNELKNVLEPYSDDEISSLKSKIMVEYTKQSGDFKTKINSLNELFTERNKNDDIYKFYVRVVLIYAFEICIIGKRTGVEKC